VNVKLNHAYSKDISIGYTVKEGTAISGKDYIIPSANNGKGTVTIKAGETVGYIEYWVKGDNISENTESFTITLDKSDDNVILSDAAFVSRVHILDNDYLKDTTAPVFKGATVQGNQLLLSYNEVLSELEPNTSNFVVKLNDQTIAVTQIDVREDQLLLTLDKSVAAQDKLVLSYTKTSLDDFFAIQDRAGNDAANIANLSVQQGFVAKDDVRVIMNQFNEITLTKATQALGTTGKNDKVIIDADTIANKVNTESWQGNLSINQNIDSIDLSGITGDKLSIHATGNVVVFSLGSTIIAKTVVQGDADGTLMHWLDAKGVGHDSSLTIKPGSGGFAVYADNTKLSANPISLVGILPDTVL
jgi:uncharacterized repeat protein (TIGR02059 family)